MALAFMLSGQSYISLMDRLEHTHAHVHFANPLAGDVQNCGGGRTACGHDHQDLGTKKATIHHYGTNNAADHQHGGSGLVFLAAKNFVLVLCRVPAERCDTASQKLVSFNPRGPDHPPKSNLELRV